MEDKDIYMDLLDVWENYKDEKWKEMMDTY